MRGEHQIWLIAGDCWLPRPTAASSTNLTIVRIPKGPPSVGTGNAKYEHVQAKFHLWELPYERIAYYDLDVEVKRPVSRCAELCPPHADMCAVRDPVATWPVRSKTYFNSGVFVMTPSKGVARALKRMGADRRQFADQDTMNEYFNTWYHLPKECNWLHHKENRPSARSDSDVLAVHLGGH